MPCRPAFREVAAASPSTVTIPSCSDLSSTALPAQVAASSAVSGAEASDSPRALPGSVRFLPHVNWTRVTGDRFRARRRCGG